MTPDLFVQNLKVATLDSAVDQSIAYILDPPGRRPDRSDQAPADWYQQLSEGDKQHARRLAQLCAEDVLFGVLCVLDGVRAIESQGPKGELELRFRKDGQSLRLNDPNCEPLHDIFNESGS